VEGKKMASESTLIPTQAEYPADPLIDDRAWPRRRPSHSDGANYPPFTNRPSLLRRASRAIARFLIAVCIGVAGTLAWQSHGDTATQMIASWAAQHGWLPAWLSAGAAANPKVAERPSASQAAPVGQTAAPAAASSDLQSFEAMTLNLAAVRQKVEQLAATQEEMANDIAKLQAAEHDIRRKISAASPGSATPPASKPVPTPPPPARAPMPVR
jgi:hypothetical protein